jgi:hypothetical protein
VGFAPVIVAADGEMVNAVDAALREGERHAAWVARRAASACSTSRGWTPPGSAVG